MKIQMLYFLSLIASHGLIRLKLQLWELFLQSLDLILELKMKKKVLGDYFNIGMFLRGEECLLLILEKINYLVFWIRKV
ncbi:MAG: hypothetical protein CMG85_19300 [Marinobacter sp.]|nr:hypothetical protein [Marinobacter sp.]